MSGRTILHVDLDAFYASVEARERPELKGLPLVVGADPKEGHGRGVVTTASYEARRFGIRSAMPISQAWRLCPDAVFVRPRFELYAEASDRVFDILRSTGAAVEGASIDEAYLDASNVCADFVEAYALARRLQRKVRERERITASVGVAANKLVAKIATDVRKPEGVTVVPEGGEAAFLAPMPARRLPGVGPKTEEALLAIGIRTCGDLASAAPAALAERLGSWGPRLVDLALGADASPVVTEWTRKSLGSETTFPEDQRDGARVAATVAALAAEAADGLVAERLAARTVTLKLRFEDFETITRSRTLDRPTDRLDALRATAEALREEAAEEARGRAVRLVGVRLSHLVDASRRQVTLDLWPADVHGEADAPWPRTWF